MMGFRTADLVMALGIGVLASLSFPAAEAKLILDSPVVLTQVPGEVKGPPPGWEAMDLIRSDWFDGARIVAISPAGEVKVLSQGFHSACDPSLSFDARRVVFAGKRERQSSWRIWEMGIDGANLRAVTPDNQEARSPIYATTLFTLDSPEPWFTLVYVGREKNLNESGSVRDASLYSVKLDGTEPRRLTYHPNLVFDPFQMWDGRVLYAAERYPLEPGASSGRVGLYSVHIVGTEMVRYGGEQGGRIQHMPCATESRTVVFVESDGAVWDGAGQLACVREQRPHHTYRALTADSAWRYLYPTPWQANRVLVSRRPADGSSTCAIYGFDLESGACEPVYDDPVYHEVQTQVARPRGQPDGHSTVVDPRQYTTGIFYGLNCYDLDERMQPHLGKGAFKRVRVIEGVSQAPGNASIAFSASQPVLGVGTGPYVARRILGEAPIETDGSFNLEVPADTPVLLQTLDERGLALGTCGWVWVKPREARGCVGCHEDPELIPENNFVLALRRPATPLTPPPRQRRSVDFLNAVAPILRNRCASVGCHGMTDSPMYLPLMSSQPASQDLQQTFATLRSAVEGGPGSPSPVPQPGKYVDPGRARTSPLIWRLFGVDTSRPWDGKTESSAPKKVRLMPPPSKGGPLSEEEIRTLVEWVDTGASWAAVSASESAPTSPRDNGN